MGFPARTGDPLLMLAMRPAYEAVVNYFARFPAQTVRASGGKTERPRGKVAMFWPCPTLAHGLYGVRLLTAIAIAGLVLLSAHYAIAASHGPFSKFLGSWRGFGQVVTSNGGSDRISCRATYSTTQSADDLTQTLVCASDSYRIEIHSNIVAVGQEVRGNWAEITRQATGSLGGRVVGGVFEGTISGPGFNGGLSLRSTGHRQLISIRPQGTDIVEVQVGLLQEADQ
jgi:hypothetical protein